MKISVVTPAYNRAHLIGECLRGVLAQSIQPHEIIVVDDGSKDNTAAIVAGFPNVRYIQQANAGPAAARNRGIREATGDFVAFLDSDDLLAAGHLEKHTSLLKAWPDLDAAFGLEAQFKGGSDLATAEHIPSGAPPMTTGPIPNTFTLIAAGLNIPTSSSLIRRTVALELGGMDEKLGLCEDLDFWIRVALSGARFGFVDSLLCYRRMHEGNLVNQKLRTKEYECAVWEKHMNAPGVAHRVSGLHYDLGSAYLRARQLDKAKVHLAKVKHATAKRRVVLAIKRTLAAFSA